MRQISGLTSIRFFAALWVVLFHLAPEWDLLRHAGAIVGAGYSAVTLFFVLSGFILSYNYLPGDYQPHEFWISRAARVLPVYLAALVISAPIFIHQCHKQGVPVVTAAIFPPLMVQAWIPKVALLWNGPGWSLSCEAFFYMLFPLILVPVASLFRRNFTLTFTVVWIIGVAPSFLYAFSHPEGFVSIDSHATLLSIIKFNPILRLPEFILGIGIGTCYVDGKRFSKPVATAVLSVIALAVLILICTNLPYPALHNAFLVPVYAVLIFAIACAPRILNNPVLVLLGQSSYSLYLLSDPIYSWCKFVAQQFGLSIHGAFNIMYLVIVLLASVASFRLIEVPGRMYIRSRFVVRKREPIPRVA